MALFSQQAAAAPPQLKISGNQIVTASGNCPVRLRGVNVSGLEYSPGGDTGTGRPTTTISGVTMTDYVSIITEAVNVWHCNIIRLPINQDYWFGCGNQHNGNAAVTTAAYRGMIQAVVNYCTSNNCYVDLDLHWSGSYNGTAPTSPCSGGGWGTAGGTSPTGSGQAPMPDWNAVTLWQSVSSIYGNNSTVLFDLFNEPFGPNGTDSTFWPTWKNGGAVAANTNPTQPAYNTPGMQQLVTTVRNTGANNVIIAGGLAWAYDLTGLPTYALTDTASGNGILYSAHVYNNKGVTAGGWDPKVTVATNNYAVMIEEFGAASTDPANWDTQTLAWINGSNNNNYVYSALAWAFSPDVGPQLLTSFSGYPTTSFHGAPVSTWLFTLNQTPAPVCGGGTPTFTPTRTFTSTWTFTATPTRTFTFTNTPTRTNTATNSFTNTTTPTRTSTPTSTNTGTNTFTITNTPTRTNSFTNTPTRSNTPTSTSTNTGTSTFTYTSTASFTNSATRTNTSSNTGTATFTPTLTNTPSFTMTNTSSPTSSFTSTSMATFTGTPTRTNTPTNTATSTFSYTPTTAFTDTFTNTSTPTRTFTPSFTNTKSFTPPNTNTPSFTNTNTPTRTNTSTNTNTPINTGTFTNSPTGTTSPTATFTHTSTVTLTSTATATGTSIFTSTTTRTNTATLTSTSTNSPTFTPTTALTDTFTSTNTVTRTFTSTFTSTSSFTPTKTITPTFTRTNTFTNTNTNTPTNTGTFTNSPTGTTTPTATSTNTWTSTFTFTLTRTNTPTPTSAFTNSSTFTPTTALTNTFTNTNTATSTFTSTHTATVTWTPTAVTVSVAAGPTPPASSIQLPGVTIPVAQFQLTNPGNNPATISTITLTASGTGNFTTGINSANLFLDVNGNGVQDGGDILLGMGNYSGATVTIDLNTSIPAGTTETFLAVYQFSNGASGSYTTRLTGASGNNATGALQFTGMPLNAATISIASATNTPAATSTSSLTPTATWTPTSTATATSTGTSTKTSTPSPTAAPSGGVIIEPPYPNPAQGPVTFRIEGNGVLEVKWSVFTSGFRKIDGGQTTLNGSGSIEWNLRDKMGVLVADGIYYVRIDVSGGAHLSKVWKVLVLR